MLLQLDLFQLKFVTDGQHTTISIPLHLAAILDEVGHRGCTAKVQGDAVGKLVRKTYRKRQIERIANVFTAIIIIFFITDVFLELILNFSAKIVKMF